ncbi:hypothetical protein BKA70DRAFT_860549 [Coprinopsis sp. MPI-PUGE-AT-0042]|nr:hypothetical protein BKA70DRAFT_860549 [Coprinopsis sp. MPI-PUGE-AT-0042]
MPPASASQEQPHDTFGRAVSTQGHSRPSRAAYVPQACSVCRHRKVRCDGKRPVCSGCMASNRADECLWVKDAPPPRKTRNEAFFQALKKRNEALKEYVTYLESLLERCQKEHGGLHGETYMQRRPRDIHMSFDDSTGTANEAGVDEGAEGDTTEIQGLIAPIQKLSLERGSLMTFGSTSIMRFKPAITSKSPPSRVKPRAGGPEAAHVLLSSASSVKSSEDSVEWARYLPKEASLTRVQHDTALDLVFKFCTSFCLRIIPSLFLRDMYRTLSVPKSSMPPKTAHYSPMLHNALLAVGLALLDEPFRSLEFRRHFGNEAKSYCDLECSQPNLSTVHAVSMLGTFFSSSGDQTLGFVYFGMAARISQALGLDVDCSEWTKMGLIEEEDVQDRYGTFWTIFAQDVNWSLYVGRDFSVRAPTENDFKDMPVPYVDTEYDQIPFDHPASGIPPRPGYLSKTFASTCELLVIARRIMSVVNGISTTQIRGFVVYEMISDIDVQLAGWKDSLPPEVDLTPSTRLAATPHQLMLHMTYWWLFVILHRPYFHRKPTFIHSSNKEIDHVKLCKRATENIMDLIRIWRDLYGLRNTTLNVFNPIFGAGTIFLLSGVQAATGLRVAHKELKHSIDSLELCVQYLGEMGKSWEMAARVESMLRSLLEDRLKPIAEKRKASGSQDGNKSPKDGGLNLYITSTSSPESNMTRQQQQTASTSPAPASTDSQPLVSTPPMAGHPAATPGQEHPSTQHVEMVAVESSTTSYLTNPMPDSSNPTFNHEMPMQPSLPYSTLNVRTPLTSASAFAVDEPSTSFAPSPVNDMWTNPAPINFDTAQYFAMLGGQQLSDVPFVGPLAFDTSFGSIDPFGLQQQQQQHVDMSHLDFAFFQAGLGQGSLDMSMPMYEDGNMGFIPPNDAPNHLSGLSTPLAAGGFPGRGVNEQPGFGRF